MRVQVLQRATRRRGRQVERLGDIPRLALGAVQHQLDAARSIAIPAALQMRLEEHLEADVDAEPDALLFTSSRGRSIRYSRFRPTVWLPTLDALGLPHVGLHVLRHSAAARGIGAGWPAKAVQAALGHRSAAFTLTVYGHLFESDLDELAAALESSSRRTGAEQAIR